MSGIPPSLPLGQSSAGPSSQGYAGLTSHLNGRPVQLNGASPTSLSSSASSPSDVSAGTPEGMDCFGNERAALADIAKYFNSLTLSDVKLKVGEETFFAHKLVLVKSSEVFDRMLSSDWEDSNKKEIELYEEGECVKVFPSFLKFLYGCHIVLNGDNTLPVLVLADKYNVEDLRDVCSNFARTNIIPKLQLKDVYHVWFQYATKGYHQDLTAACVKALSEKMDDIAFSAEWEEEWLNLDMEQLIQFLQSSHLTIKDEFELFKAVMKWLKSPGHTQRMVNVEQNLMALLPHVRFPMMTPDQLCELEKSKLVEQHQQVFQPYLMLAFKYHSLPLSSRGVMQEFFSTSFLLRNYTDLRWDKRLEVPGYAAYHKCAEVGLHFTTRSSSFPAQTWEWELKVYPKGFSSTSDDFRCILYSNLILDQPRPVEFLLSVVDSTRILCTVTGKKNFSKNRYTSDTEIDKKISIADLTAAGSPYLVNDTLTMQIILRPVD